MRTTVNVKIISKLIFLNLNCYHDNWIIFTNFISQTNIQENRQANRKLSHDSNINNWNNKTRTF